MCSEGLKAKQLILDSRTVGPGLRGLIFAANPHPSNLAQLAGTKKN